VSTVPSPPTRFQWAFRWEISRTSAGGREAEGVAPLVSGACAVPTQGTVSG